MPRSNKCLYAVHRCRRRRRVSAVGFPYGLVPRDVLTLVHRRLVFSVRNTRLFGSAQRRVYRLDANGAGIGANPWPVYVESQDYYPKQRSYWAKENGWLIMNGFSTGAANQLFNTPVYGTNGELLAVSVSGNNGNYACGDSCRSASFSTRAARSIGMEVTTTNGTLSSLNTVAGLKALGAAVYAG